MAGSIAPPDTPSTPATEARLRAAMRASRLGFRERDLDTFDPFFTTKAQGEGTGLGLSMVDAFARQSRGCVTAEPAPGAGTRMRLYLPGEAA